MTLPQLQALQTSSGWDIAAHADTVADHNAGFANLENPVVEADLQGIAGPQETFPPGETVAEVLES